jgi:hypothetical protein
MGSKGSIARSLFAEDDKGKARIGGYLPMGPFILDLDSFYGLISNFSCSITCFEAVFLFITVAHLLESLISKSRMLIEIVLCSS